jgi:hypothetical protein
LLHFCCPQQGAHACAFGFGLLCGACALHARRRGASTIYAPLYTHAFATPRRWWTLAGCADGGRGGAFCSRSPAIILLFTFCLILVHPTTCAVALLVHRHTGGICWYRYEYVSVLLAERHAAACWRGVSGGGRGLDCSLHAILQRLRMRITAACLLMVTRR